MLENAMLDNATTTPHPMMACVEQALAAYAASIQDCGAGYALIRYARKGLLAPLPGTGPELAPMLEALRGDDDKPTFAWNGFLRLAHAGAFGFDAGAEHPLGRHG